MKKSEQPFAWIFIVVVAIVYAMLVFVACSLNSATNFWSFYVAWTITVPALLLFGCWAALGSGVAWLRVTAISLLGPLLFVAAVAGFYTSFSQGYPQGFFFDGGGPFKIFTMVFLISFGACVACQIPFWIFRFLFGWQLIQKDRDWSQQKISIRDIFVLTAIFAFSFGLPSVGVNMYFDSIVQDVQIGSTELIETDEIDENGEPIVFNEVLVTKENIEEVRESRNKQYKEFRSSMTAGVLVYSAIVAVFALLFVPVVLLSLRTRGTGVGVFLAGIYLCLIMLIAGIVPNVLLSGAFIVWEQFIPYLLAFTLLFVTAAMLPLIVSRSMGIRLASNRDFRKRRNESMLDKSSDSLPVIEN